MGKLQRKGVRRGNSRPRIPKQVYPALPQLIWFLLNMFRKPLYTFRSDNVQLLVENLSSKICHTVLYSCIKHAAAISHPTNRPCFGTIMHAMAVTKVPARRSKTSCPALQDFFTVCFLHDTYFCSSRTTRLTTVPVPCLATTFSSDGA